MGQGLRRQGRLAAAQILYMKDCRGLDHLPQEELEQFYSHFLPNLPAKARAFATELFLGLTRRQEEVDALLRSCAERWRLERMDRMDRSILRLAAHELTTPDGPPPEVVVDEAVELSKDLCSDRSPSFINGVLARVIKSL